MAFDIENGLFEQNPRHNRLSGGSIVMISKKASMTLTLSKKIYCSLESLLNPNFWFPA